MSSPTWEMQKAIYATLKADSALVALLGGERIYDEVPRGADGETYQGIARFRAVTEPLP